MPANNMLLSSSPHVYTGVTPRKLMLSVIIALSPVSVYGVVLYGVHALLVIVVSIATARVLGFAAAGRAAKVTTATTIMNTSSRGRFTEKS
ncbi:MAG TPA: RnfABCDGE type electron transport complex subunit D [Spirochaetales bacterium]|nr:RnfABCDGE type electron transport complex subunit D [Spirochaetales bacterium]